MSTIPDGLYYTKDHEWIEVEENVASVGITDHAQSELGDITFVELPGEDDQFNAGDEAAQIESVKAASPVFSPLTGTVLEFNADLEDEPGAVNSDPYGAGWLFKLEIKNPDELKELLSATDYEAFLAEAE